MSKASGGEAGGRGAAGPPATDAIDAQQAFDAWVRALETGPAGFDALLNTGPFRELIPVDWAAVAASLRRLGAESARDPVATAAALAELQLRLWQAGSRAWVEGTDRWLRALGGSTPERKPEPDRRFAAPEWSDNPVFRALKDCYKVASEWLLARAEAEDMDEAERQRLAFHLRQFVDATSPALGLATNPIAIKKAFETGGASLAEGLSNLRRDLDAGRLSMVDLNAFAPGRNLALTPGKVVHRNPLIELIQYAPQTDAVHARPLLLVPPWINKYYILDLQPKNSLIAFLVGQGFTVFAISWKNVDASMDETSFEDYMRLGPLAAQEAIRDITGAATANVMGYCIGGTLLAMALAWLAARRQRRFHSATFIVSLQDFARVGDTAIFMGEDAIDFIDQEMLRRGYLDSRAMADMFNLLRANDLIWSNVVNNYLLGNKPPAFDLLYWNSDGTRMARAAHSWYLHNTYVANNLIAPGRIELAGTPIDLGKVKLDIYAIGAEADHIVPWQAAWRARQLFGGPVRFVLASSGHVAGIINPPGGKGAYWVNDAPDAPTPEAWRAAATRHEGSWWTDWAAWLAERSGGRAAPPPLGSAAFPPLEDAPGSYVLER